MVLFPLAFHLHGGEPNVFNPPRRLVAFALFFLLMIFSVFGCGAFLIPVL